MIETIKMFIFNDTFLVFLIFFFLPFCVNLSGCIKLKRNIFYSLIFSALYPAIILFSIFICMFIFFNVGGWISDNYDYPKWINFILIMIGLPIFFYPVGSIWMKVSTFFENFKEEGLMTFDIEVYRRRLNKKNENK